MRQIGVSCGDCFVVCSSGIPEVVGFILAASKIGAVANMLNPTFQADQMVDRINETGAKLLFVMDKIYSFIRDVIDKTCIELIIGQYRIMQNPEKCDNNYKYG